MRVFVGRDVVRWLWGGGEGEGATEISASTKFLPTAVSICQLPTLCLLCSGL